MERTIQFLEYEAKVYGDQRARVLLAKWKTEGCLIDVEVYEIRRMIAAAVTRDNARKARAEGKSAARAEARAMAEETAEQARAAAATARARAVQAKIAAKFRDKRRQ